MMRNLRTLTPVLIGAAVLLGGPAFAQVDLGGGGSIGGVPGTPAGSATGSADVAPGLPSTGSQEALPADPGIENPSAGIDEVAPSGSAALEGATDGTKADGRAEVTADTEEEEAE